MLFSFRFLCVASLFLGAVLPCAAATSPGSIMPQQGPAYDAIVNETRSMPMQEGREGYIGTHTDPATGDIITNVVSPRMPQQQQQQTPIIVYPQVGSPYNPVLQNDGDYGIQYGNQIYGGPHHGTPGWHGGGQRPPQVQHRPGGHPAGTPPPGLMPHSGSGVRPGASSPHGNRVPNLPGNRVEHKGYSLPGGNPGNMGHYRPEHAGRRP